MIAAGQNMQKRRRDIGQADTVTTDNQPVCHQRILTHHLDDLSGHPTRQGNLFAGPSGHGLIGRDVLIAPQPFPQVDVVGTLPFSSSTVSMSSPPPKRSPNWPSR